MSPLTQGLNYLSACDILYMCKKAAGMTAKLIRYIGFSLYNCLKITVRGSGKPVEFHFAKFVSILYNVM